MPSKKSLLETYKNVLSPWKGQTTYQAVYGMKNHVESPLGQREGIKCIH